MSSLISRVKSELLDPLAIYRFLDAATKSLTIDSQLGGITGLYNLGQSLRGIPSSKIAFFTIPNFPRGDVVPGDTANVLWTQPEDNQIFASFRDDVPASSTLFGSGAAGDDDGRRRRAWPRPASSRDSPASRRGSPSGSATRTAGPSARPASRPDRQPGHHPGAHRQPVHLRRLTRRPSAPAAGYR